MSRGCATEPDTLEQSYEELCHFVETEHTGGCNTFIVHARIAILKGLSPKEVHLI